MGGHFNRMLDRMVAGFIAYDGARPNVSRAGESTGVWRRPPHGSQARNYYLIVEAITPQGEKLSLPIRNEETGTVETVSKFGVRVPQDTFETVARDKRDDGIVQKNRFGEKRRGVVGRKLRNAVRGWLHHKLLATPRRGAILLLWKFVQRRCGIAQARDKCLCGPDRRGTVNAQRRPTSPAPPSPADSTAARNWSQVCDETPMAARPRGRKKCKTRCASISTPLSARARRPPYANHCRCC